jgi:cellulose synthase/poly-beta-1,6-N-acetylglucosamine synthase-like glycosyltransferase
METVFYVIIRALQFFVTAFAIYYVLVSLFGLRRHEESDYLPPQCRFALVIAAHNEEKVIGQLVSNLQQMDYPRELYDIYVIADNCTDRTAEVAREQGARVIERFNRREQGKGYALEYGFGQILSSDPNYDAVVVFDADNLVSTNFLLVMNTRLLRGESIIQGYLATKNPDDTWITKAICVGYLITNRFWQLAKYRLGLSCALGGTGMCISVPVLRRYGWGMTSLTEDLEFQTKALLNGLRVSWAHEARVFDEKPLTLRRSWRQRRRWMQGHCDVAGRYFIRLLWQGLCRRDPAMVDGALYLCQPFLVMVCGVLLVYNLMHVQFHTALFWVLVSLALQISYFSIALRLERVERAVYSWLFYYPAFILTWIPVAFVGYLLRKKKEWTHTLHVRGIRYENLRTYTLREK